MTLTIALCWVVGLAVAAASDIVWGEQLQAYSLPIPGRQLLNDTEQYAIGTGHVVVDHANETETAKSMALRFRRCAMTQGNWCQAYLRQTPFPVKKAPQGSKDCKDGCNKRGNCNYDTGICDCAIGWTGDDCSERQLRPCTNRHRSEGKEPLSHTGPDGLDKDLKEGGWTASRCAGWCDVTNAACYCPPNTKFGHIPAPEGSAPDTPPVKQGRTMLDCPPGTNEKGEKLEWGRPHLPWEALYSKEHGWCESEHPRHGCGCPLDGTVDCFVATEKWCPNQCTGHGTCMSGWCYCHQGWYGHDCSRPKQGMDFATGLETVRPWIADLVKQPLEVQVKPETKTRRRPLIYVYDLPNIFNTRMKQYAMYGSTCTWRTADNHQNRTRIVDELVYSAEQLLHELMLRSDHRTFDPEEADYFYMPTYITCFSWPVNGWADFPWFHGPVAHPRVMHFTNMIADAKDWVQKNMPYWDRRGGKDHIFFMPNDEGACVAPNTAWPAIFLSHWGRTDWSHVSGTAYPPDNYTEPDWKHKEFEPLGWQRLIKGKPCYDPRKDLLIPAFKAPSSYSQSPFLSSPSKAQPARDILLFFRGDVGKHRLPWYSRRIRQRLFEMSRAKGWDKTYNVQIGAREDIPGSYSDLIRRSKFCLCAPGDGWSARFEDSVLHGCIPVIIKDNVMETFETIMQVEQYSVRVVEADLELLPDILSAIPDKKLAEMQAHLAAAWHRYAYVDHPILEKALLEAMRREGLDDEAAKKQYSHMQHDDAFHTIMQWLHHMIPLTR